MSSRCSATGARSRTSHALGRIRMDLIRSTALLLALSMLGGCASTATRTRDATAQDCAKSLAQAQQGDAAAQFDTGICYENGQNGPVDYATAAVWYRKSADHGYADAETNLAYLYNNGLGVPRDDEQAFAWYSKAAAQGESHAEES